MGNINQLPKYLQIEKYLLNKIESGEYKKGSKLPSERELGEKFGISRMTARNALSELVKSGVAVRKGTAGTLVTGIKKKKNLTQVESFTSYFRNQGVREISAVVLRRETKEADASVSECLSVELGTVYHRLVRLRLADGQPVAVEESLINALFLPDFDNYTFVNDSLWEILRRDENSAPVRARTQIEMRYLSRDISQYLGVKTDTQAFVMDNAAFNSHGDIVEWSRTYYPGDNYCFSFESAIF